MVSSLRFVPATFATAVVALVIATRPIAPIPRLIALVAVVFAWGAAIAVQNRSLRAHTTVVGAIAAAVAAGQVDAGLPYGIACGMLLLGCVAAMRAARVPEAAGGPRLPPVRSVVVLGGIAALVTATLVLGLPKIAAHIERKITAMFGGDGVEGTAFSTTMVLGATRGMLQSDAVVLRIDGEHPEYLRGAVYDSYTPPFWAATGPGRRRTKVPATSAHTSTTITLVRGAPNGEDMRWFLPAGACDLDLPAKQLEVDAFGIARRARADEPVTIRYRTAGCASSPAPILPPSATDLDVPPKVRRVLEPIAAGWTVGAKTDREKLAKLRQELSRFEYSLEVPRTTGMDPVVDFVTVHRAGHCEMFASAMALMARTQGIPARVIGGYHVTEVNPVTGQAVVRDRNAHAWIEAWVDGAWRGMDPTPVSEELAPRASSLDYVTDVLSMAFDRVALALTRLGLLGTAAVLGGFVALLLAIRWIGLRLREGRARRDPKRAGSLPLPAFEALTSALSGSGIERDDSEPIEALARRVGALEAPWARDASLALFDYASLRYGGIGDEKVVVRTLERAARAISVAFPTRRGAPRDARATPSTGSSPRGTSGDPPGRSPDADG